MTKPLTERNERGDSPSASSMDRCFHCPGSFEAEKGLPELPPEDVTAEGNAIHDSMETGDDSELGFTQKQIAKRLEAMKQHALDNWLVAIHNGDI